MKRQEGDDEHERLLYALGRTVLRLRKARGWSQLDLNEETGLNRTYIIAVEGGDQNISIKSLARVARIFGLKPWQLLKRAETLKKRIEIKKTLPNKSKRLR